MGCQETHGLLDAYLDGELDLTASLELEQHLKDCADCQARKTQHDLLSKVLQLPGLYAKAPAGLDHKIRANLRVSNPQTDTKKVSPMWRWAAMAAGVAALIISSVVLLKDMSHPGRDEMLAREVVSSHVRSLMANHLTDVLSSDQHTVKPWFNGKLDFTPLVKDLGEKGFPLTGGRLDYLDDRPVAALLYKRNQHPINLFEWPDTAVSQPHTMTIRGYNIVHWGRDGMAFWAVSDLNKSELAEFVRNLP